jgi:glycosyltransferase involved in cell wall biosynthesis
MILPIRRLGPLVTRAAAFLKFRKRERIKAVIAKARLFDSNWYLSRGPNDDQALADPLAHYVAHGAAQGRDPHPLFDTKWYLAQNHDGAIADINPFTHYLAHGASEGRDPHPLFDTKWYLAQNPELDLAKVNPLVHYLTYHTAKARDPHPLFDTEWYLAQTPSIDPVKIDPLVHYIARGASEGRDPHPLFDSSWYLAQNPDVAMAEINPLAHYVTRGASEGRDPHPLFDCAWYFAQNPDLDLAKVNPLVHYLTHHTAKTSDPHPLFDTDWYLAQIPNLDRTRLNPVIHYITQGALQRCSPHPLFDTNWYVSQNPGLDLTNVTPLVHYVITSAYQRREPNRRLQKRLDDAFETAAKGLPILAAIEPELAESIRPSDIKSLKHVTGRARGVQYATCQQLFKSLTQTYDRMIFVPASAFGGRYWRRTHFAALNALKAAHLRHGPDTTLLVVADSGTISQPHGLPPGTHIRTLSGFHPGLTAGARMEVIATLIYHLQPKAILNINSSTLWDAIAERGAGLSRVTDLYAYAFTATRSPDGSIARHPDRLLATCFPHLTRIYSDSAFALDLLVRNYGVSETLRERFKVVYQPSRILHELSSPDPSQRECREKSFRVLWLGSTCPEENPHLVVEIARRCPEISFDLYGSGADLFTDEFKKLAPSNMKLRGASDCVGTIPVEQYSAFLYTSLHEDIPNVAIEIAARGVPIIAPNIDNISEFIDHDGGWLIEDYRRPAEYIEALDRIKQSPEDVARRVQKMLATAHERHSWDSFIRSFSQSPSFLD